MSSEGAEGAEPAMDTGDEPMTKVPGGCRLLRRRRGRQKNELRIRCLTSADQARRLPIPVEFTPRLNKQRGRCSLGLCNRNGSRGSLPHSLCLCLGSLAALGPAKVVGLESASEWNANGPTDFGGPAAIREATEATATGKAPGIQDDQYETDETPPTTFRRRHHKRRLGNGCSIRVA